MRYFLLLLILKLINLRATSNSQTSCLSIGGIRQKHFSNFFMVFRTFRKTQEAFFLTPFKGLVTCVKSYYLKVILWKS